MELNLILLSSYMGLGENSRNSLDKSCCFLQISPSQTRQLITTFTRLGSTQLQLRGVKKTCIINKSTHKPFLRKPVWEAHAFRMTIQHVLPKKDYPKQLQKWLVSLHVHFSSITASNVYILIVFMLSAVSATIVKGFKAM